MPPACRLLDQAISLASACERGGCHGGFVPKTDSDGNEIAGIRLPELVVPLATYTGWALRSGVWANDGCEPSVQYIPFEANHDGSAGQG